ncbi:MAG: aspartate 1-decarboxylase [Actinomycetaceae bacterium]|nr:aspartate 1-decarboxylase [Actinomycetaceae bacterium]
MSDFAGRRFRHMLSAKIHRATVTGADVDYVGSVSIDTALLEAADIAEGEKVSVVDVTNGARLETYVIPGDPGQIQMNGAAAHLIKPGDLVIIIAYALVDDAYLDEHQPRVVHVDAQNRQLGDVVVGPPGHATPYSQS